MYLNESNNSIPGLYGGAVDLNEDGYADADKVIQVDSEGNLLDRLPVVPQNSSGTEILTPTNPGEITINRRFVSDEHVFHDAATETGSGTALMLNGHNRVIVSIARTSITANTISFKATGPGGVVGYILGYKIESGGTITADASSTAATDEVWIFDDLAGYTDIIISIDSMTGTSITVKGRAVG
jgi:hypothetical protein